LRSRVLWSSISGALQGEGKYPLVIMVHGDGPAYRSYFFALKKSMLRARYATLMWDETGSLRERSQRSAKEWQDYAPEYLEIMEDWLKKPLR